MNRAYRLSHRLVAGILLLSLCLQACSNFYNPIVVNIKKVAITPQQSADQDSIRQLVDKEFTAEGGHIVTFHAQEGKLRADVTIYGTEDSIKPTVCRNLPVVMDKDLYVAQLSSSSKEEQKRSIHFNLPKNGNQGSVEIYRSALMGGMNNPGGSSGKKASKGKETREKKKTRKRNSHKGSVPTSESKVNNQYEYEDNDIVSILRSRLTQLINQSPTYASKLIDILGPVDNIMPNQLKNVLEQDKVHNPQARILLIPCNLGLFHWVGILIEINDNQQVIRAAYVDSLEGVGGISPDLQRQIQAVYPGCHVQTLSLLKQDDRTSCGAYTIENLLLALQNTVVSQISTEEIRQSHLTSLRQHNPSFYHTFYPRQRGNIRTTATLEQQFGYHNKSTQAPRFSKQELRAILVIYKCLSSIKDVSMKEPLWKAFQPKDRYKNDCKPHLDSIRSALKEAATKLVGDQDKKSLYDMIEVIFGYRCDEGSVAIIGSSVFRLQYEAILAVTKINSKADDIDATQKEIDEQIKKDEKLARQLHAEFLEEMLLKMMQQDLKEGEDASLEQQNQETAALPWGLDISFLDKCYNNPLRDFKKSEDLIHFESILKIIESDKFGNRINQDLLTLSRYFEALSVYKQALTDRHWKSGEDHTTLTLWNMLSYYSHCSDEFRRSHPRILEHISGKLVEAYKQDAPIFRKIFKYEELKEQHNYLKLNLIEYQIRKFYETMYERPFIEASEEAEQTTKIIWGISVIAGPLECRELTKIKARKFLLPEWKLDRTNKIWDGLAQKHLQSSSRSEALNLKLEDSSEKIPPTKHRDDSIRDRVVRSKNVIKITKVIQDIESKMEIEKSIIEMMTKTAELNQAKRALQGLYEYEQLKIVLECTKRLLQEDQVSQEALIQWLVILREGLKKMITDKSLGIEESPCFLELFKNLKKIRDYFEHPEDFVLVLDFKDEEEKNKQRQGLEKALFLELKKFGQEVAKSIEERLEGIEKLLLNEDAEEILTKLTLREQQWQQVTSPVIKESVLKEYPAITRFNDKVLSKQDKKDRKKIEEIKKKDKEYLYIPLSFHSSKEDILVLLKRACQSLQSSIDKLHRVQLEKKIAEDLPFRLMIQRQISNAERYLEQFMQKARKGDEFIKHIYDTIEGIYFQARDTRNFQTHDLWRKDIQGTINIIYLLAHDLPTALTNSLKSDYFKEKSLEHTVVQEVVLNKLTRKSLLIEIGQGLDINARDYKGRTLLHFLAGNKSVKNLKLAKFIILHHGANIHHADYLQMRPLHYAAESGFTKLVKFLLEHGATADVISEYGTPAEIAQQHEHVELAVFLNEKEGIRRLSNARALLHTVKSLDVLEAQNLVDNGFDPNADFSGTLPLVDLFRKEGIIDSSIQIQIAKILLNAGADINQQEPSSGQTALHAAADCTDQPEVIDFLMKLGPNINLQNNQLETPLHNAVACRHENWVEALLMAKAQVDITGMFKDTPLLHACKKSNRLSYNIISNLLKYNANVEAENQYGRAIHYVAEHGDEVIVSLVLKYGASPFVLGKKDSFYNKIPFQIATEPRVKEILLQKMRVIYLASNSEEKKKLAKIMSSVYEHIPHIPRL